MKPTGRRSQFPPVDSAARAPLRLILSRLKGVIALGDERCIALCPSHDDQQQSLSITTGRDGRTLVHCHAGCEPAAIVQAIGLTLGDLFPKSRAPTTVTSPTGPYVKGVNRRPKLVATYDYCAASGMLAFQSCRFEPKTFRQRRRGANGEWIYDLKGLMPILYRLPELLEAVAHERRVFVVEGEKDADALTALGYIATTSPMGAGKWRDEYGCVLSGADVVVLPDNDDPGRAHAADVARSLYAHNATVKIVALPGVPEKGDVSDWLDLGHNVDELERLAEQTPRWMPDPSQRTRWRLDEVWESEELMRPPPPVVPYLAWASRSTLLAAREKSGKSTIVGYVAARVSRGGDFLGEPCQHGRVVIVGLEEFIGDTARRLKEFGANGAAVFLVDRFKGEARERLAEIRAHIEAVKPVLVIVDSLVAYAQGVVTDANSATQTQAIVQGLTDLSHTTAVALIVIHHARKADGKYRDSSAIGGAVDIIAEVFPPEECAISDPTRRRVRPIGRVATRGVEFRFDGHEYTLVDPSTQAKAPLGQRIQFVVRDRPGCSANDVCEAIGDQRARVLPQIASMIASGHIINDGTARRMRLTLPTLAPGQGLL